MIAEPYICIKGQCLGEIQWYTQPWTEEWQPYADFEREKLKELDADGGINVRGYGFTMWIRGGNRYDSTGLIRYTEDQYNNDSESGRLLKRAEFLKAVCEKEGIAFLPQQDQTSDVKTCCIEGCQNEGCNGRGNHCWKHYQRIRKYGDPHMIGHQWKIESLNDHDGIKRMIEEKVAVNIETGCWEWTGARQKQGYGKQTIKRSKQQTFPAHRLAAMVYLGFDIDSEELICHKCDNPPCCNPDHLFVGDWKANAADMVAKGRAVDVSDRQRSDGGTFLPKAA